MATGTDFEGSNIIFRGGRPNVNDIPAFRNQQCVVTCWELTDDEIEILIHTRKVYQMQFYAGNLVPHYLTPDRENMREMVADYGGAFK